MQVLVHGSWYVDGMVVYLLGTLLRVWICCLPLYQYETLLDEKTTGFILYRQNVMCESKTKQSCIMVALVMNTGQCLSVSI